MLMYGLEATSNGYTTVDGHSILWSEGGETVIPIAVFFYLYQFPVIWSLLCDLHNFLSNVPFFRSFLTLMEPTGAAIEGAVYPTNVPTED